MGLVNSLNKRRIPTILGLVVLIAGLGAGLFVVGQATIIPRAAAEETPKEIKVTNINETTFTVSWMTEMATSGFVRYGMAAGNLDQTIFDDRDQLSGEVGSFLTHHVTLQNLKAGTEYFFKLGSGTRRVLYDNSGQPYAIKTASKSGTPPAADTVYGTVVTQAGTPAEGAVVYLTLPGAVPLSAVVKAAGNWAVPLSTSRTSDLTAYVTYDRQATTVEIFVQGGGGQTATAVTVTANDSPVPQISLGQAHDFRSDVPTAEEEAGTPGQLPPGADLRSGLPGATESSPSGEASGSSGFSFGSLGGNQLPEESTYTLEILNPEEEGETVASTKPEIFGTSPQNVTLTITVESPQSYTGEVEVDEDGLWQWTPPTGLTPGEHTVTASYTDENGILQQVKRKFVVAAATGSGSAGLPAFEATPSATASPSAAPRVSQPSTASGVPTAGVLTPTIVIFILGLGLLSAGLFWQLQYRKLT